MLMSYWSFSSVIHFLVVVGRLIYFGQLNMTVPSFSWICPGERTASKKEMDFLKQIMHAVEQRQCFCGGVPSMFEKYQLN